MREKKEIDSKLEMVGWMLIEIKLGHGYRGEKKREGGGSIKVFCSATFALPPSLPFPS